MAGSMAMVAPLKFNRLRVPAKMKQKRFHLSLTIFKLTEKQISFVETFESDNLLEVISKFALSLARFQQLQEEATNKYYDSRLIDDDIPF